MKIAIVLKDQLTSFKCLYYICVIHQLNTDTDIVFQHCERCKHHSLYLLDKELTSIYTYISTHIITYDI